MTDLPEYLCRSAKKLALDWIRRQVVGEMSAPQVPASQTSPCGDCREPPGTRSRTPGRRTTALFMANQDGLDYMEIGARLDITPDVAKRLVEKAMEYLLEAVSKPVDPDPSSRRFPRRPRRK